MSSSTHRFVALLRGINVSGQKLINMKELVSILAQDGFRDVTTYIQSGNIALEAETPVPWEVADRISAAIRRQWEFEVPVIALTGEDLEAIIRDQPFPEGPGDVPDRRYVTFLKKKPAVLPELDPMAYEGDRYVITDRAVYLDCRNGYGRTRLTNTFWEGKLGVEASSRNWRTVLKLAEMARG